jgi:ATP-dependent Clp protease ATP-binding subunit ClpA
MLNPDRLTVKSAEAFNDAVGRARRAGNPLVYDVHLLAALIEQDEGIVSPILQKLGVNVADCARRWRRRPRATRSRATRSPRSRASSTRSRTAPTRRRGS